MANPHWTRRWMVLANLTPFTCYSPDTAKRTLVSFIQIQASNHRPKWSNKWSNQIFVKYVFPPQILVASSHMVLIRISHEYLIHLEVHHRLHCTTHPFWLIAIPRQPWQRHLSGGPFLVAEGYRGRTKRGKRTVCQTSGRRLEAGGFRSDIVDMYIWCIYGIYAVCVICYDVCK